MFVNAAEEVLLPLLDMCKTKTNQTEAEEPHLSRTPLLSLKINAAVVFRSKSLLRFNRIYRRLAGRRSIRQPYYCNILRDIPVEMINTLTRTMGTHKFREPFCYVAGNRKGKVISFTSTIVKGIS